LVQHLTKSKITVLGSTGYIGTNLIKSFLDRGEIQQISKNNSEQIILSKNEQNIIINLCASKPNATLDESFEGNFNFQQNVIRRNLDKNILWIQIASYYELQIKLGRVDHYSNHKFHFRKFLNEWSSDHVNFKYKCLFLPHIFGRNESANRLIPSIRQLNLGQKTMFGPKNQQIPLLFIDDAIRAILLSIEANQKVSTAIPIWYDKLNVLVKETVKTKFIDDFSEFHGSAPKYLAKQVKFPHQLINFAPRFTFSELKSKLKGGVHF